MIHIVIPEGVNRLDGVDQPLSDYYEARLRRVAEKAANERQSTSLREMRSITLTPRTKSPRASL